MDRENFVVRMDQLWMVIFQKVKYQEWLIYSFLMAIRMKVNGKITRHMDLVYTSIIRAPHMKDTGTKTCKVVSV